MLAMIFHVPVQLIENFFSGCKFPGNLRHFDHFSHFEAAITRRPLKNHSNRNNVLYICSFL